MKRIYGIMVLLLVTITFQAQQFNVATYNLRNENTHDLGNLWKDRYPYVAKLVLYHDFDIFGTQEALPGQLDDLKKALPDYSWYGEGRDGKNQGEHAAIFFKKSKYTLLDSGDFWLSSTPNIPSKSWDAPCCNRICSWIKLEDKTSKRSFYIFNAHYDYEKDYARNQSSLLILDKIKQIAGSNAVIFMGDLNGTSNDSWCKIIQESGLVRDTHSDVDTPYDNGPSYNGWGKLDNLDESDRNLIKNKDIIDHIYISNHFKTTKWGLLTDTYNCGKFPSDHFPILTNLEWVR